MWIAVPNEALYHHGIKGQRWGIRRFQPYPNGHTGGKFVGGLIKECPSQRDIRQRKMQKSMLGLRCSMEKGPEPVEN